MLAVYFILWYIKKKKEDTAKKTILCENFSLVFCFRGQISSFKLFSIASGLKFEVWLSFV